MVTHYSDKNKNSLNKLFKRKYKVNPVTEKRVKGKRSDKVNKLFKKMLNL